MRSVCCTLFGFPVLPSFLPSFVAVVSIASQVQGADAQWLASGSSYIYLDGASANAIIGSTSTSPTTKLQVDGGDVRIRTNDGGSLYLDDNTQNNPAYTNGSLTWRYGSGLSTVASVHNLYSVGGLTFDVFAMTDALTIRHTSGSVGIGTTTPRGRLDVAGTGDVYLATSTVSGDTRSLYVPGHIYIGPYNGGNVSYVQARRSDNSGTTELQFRTYNSGSLTDALRISGSANVGVGTSSPGAKLSVVETANGAYLFAGYNSSSQNLFNFQVQSNGRTTLGIRDAPAGTEKISLDAGGSSYLNGGNVGIGTAGAPSEKLEVAGNIKASDTLKAGRVTVGSYYGGSTIRQATGPTRVEVIGHFGVTSDAYVTGDVTCDTVRCNGVVMNGWTLDAPDYVFEPGYKLRPISDLEQHVKQHKHLPDVPSAAQIKQNGLDVAQMNMALLKKVEELTLYVIQQQKQISELKAQMDVR